MHDFHFQSPFLSLSIFFFMDCRDRFSQVPFGLKKKKKKKKKRKGTTASIYNVELLMSHEFLFDVSFLKKIMMFLYFYVI